MDFGVASFQTASQVAHYNKMKLEEHEIEMQIQSELTDSERKH